MNTELKKAQVAALQKALDYFGGSQTMLANAIGVESNQVVNNWVRRGSGVPVEWCTRVEEATDHHVLCEEMQPNGRWHVIERRAARLRRKQKLANRVAA